MAPQVAVMSLRLAGWGQLPAEAWAEPGSQLKGGGAAVGGAGQSVERRWSSC